MSLLILHLTASADTHTRHIYLSRFTRRLCRINRLHLLPASIFHCITTMPIPFGVSVGDFVVCIDLIKTITDSLNDARGSSAQYHGLVKSLGSLESALVRLRTIRTSCPDKRIALERIALQCMCTLSSFRDKVEKYQQSLKLGGSRNRAKDSFRKVQWALYAKDDIAWFQTEIRCHVDAILIFLNVVQT